MSRFIGSITAALIALAWVGLAFAPMPPAVLGGMTILTAIAALMTVLTLR